MNIEQHLELYKGIFHRALDIFFCVCDFLCGVGGKKEVILKVLPDRSYKEDMGCVRQDIFLV